MCMCVYLSIWISMSSTGTKTFIYKHIHTHTQTPYKLVHVSKAPIFSVEECQAVIDEVEERAAEKGWTTKRHFGMCVCVCVCVCRFSFFLPPCTEICFSHIKIHTHTAYPTTDVPVQELPRTHAWFNEQVCVHLLIFTHTHTHI